MKPFFEFGKSPVTLASLFVLSAAWACSSVTDSEVDPGDRASAGEGDGGQGSLSDSAATDAPSGPDSGPTAEDPTLPFTLVVVPDTQVTTYKWPDDYFAQMKWIVDQKSARNIRYVLHVGDIQEWPETTSYFVNARKGMDLLAEANVPFTIAIGNHDFDKWSDGTHAAIAADRSTTIFNSYFPVTEAAKLPTFGGSFPAGTNDNAYHVFTAGGTEWLTLALNYQATDAEIAWANGVIASNPKRRVILTTHDYMNGGGNRDAFGSKLWDALVRKHKNMAFVLCGHLTVASRRIDTGDQGNSVIQILSDYQDYDSREPNSYLRTMTFDPVEKSVAVKTYSPALDRSMTGDAHDFKLTNVGFGDVP